MFFDFSSAFSTIQPYLLAEKLLKMKISAPTILLVLDYLTSRSQYVKLGPFVISTTIYANTGAPQGTVLCPFLFSLYTADCKNVHKRAQQQSLPMTMDLLDKQQMMTTPATDKR